MNCPINKEVAEFETFIVKCVAIVAACSDEEAQKVWDGVDRTTRSCILKYSETMESAYNLDNRFLVTLRNSIEKVPLLEDVMTFDSSLLVNLVECRVKYALVEMRID